MSINKNNLKRYLGDSEGDKTIKPKTRPNKRNNRCVSFASGNNLVSALSVNKSESIPFDSLEIVRKSSNEEDDCESVSLSTIKRSFFF